MSAATLLSVLIFAAQDSGNPLVAYGLLGIILVVFTGLILAGKLVPGKTHDRVLAEKDEANTRANAIEASMRQDVLPVMTRFLDLQNQLTAEAHRDRRRD